MTGHEGEVQTGQWEKAPRWEDHWSVTGTGVPGKAPSLSEFKGHLDDVLSHIV